MAMLAAAKFVFENEAPPISGQIPVLASKAEVYTFGQPRVGNRKFVNWFENLQIARVFRVRNQNDCVAQPLGALNLHAPGDAVMYPAGDFLSKKKKKKNWDAKYSY